MGKQNLHHRIPKIKGGQDDFKNLIKVDQERHQKWHSAFETFDPITVAYILSLSSPEKEKKFFLCTKYMNDESIKYSCYEIASFLFNKERCEFIKKKVKILFTENPIIYLDEINSVWLPEKTPLTIKKKIKPKGYMSNRWFIDQNKLLINDKK